MENKTNIVLKNKGFTLMELLIAIMLSSILIMLVFTYFSGVYSLTNRIGDNLELKGDSSTVMGVIYYQLNSIKKINYLKNNEISYLNSKFDNCNIKQINEVIYINNKQFYLKNKLNLSFKRDNAYLFINLKSSDKSEKMVVKLKQRVLEGLNEEL